ncbi:uncharacterized protein LOC110670763 isoform X2 [Hevea brasiliensis]|uniref:uncharacterized protein LOC110670763 isoform X2 n=1 Tax=Hevea brasiliensis TaxID=3981 RepID=UPI0025D60F9D|nr:uncharacterized protein LOC110670763 isoform X2 [Hevea brasiliensis]
MEAAEVEEALRVLDSSLSHIKWRLKSPSKHRLQLDVLALCTEMRPVIMVDYGGKMPELQEQLCALLKLCQQMVTQAEESSLVTELIRVQNLFSLFFPLNEMDNDLLSCHMKDTAANAESSTNKPIISQSPEFIDLSSCMQDTQVTVPTLNGWLLGYPVVYLFSKEHIADAIYNLSTKYLRIFRILVSRSISPNKGSQPEELMSFSVPYELSMGGSKEQWAEAFLAQMQSRWEKCKNIWRPLQMEVSECYPQAIVL